MGKTTFAQALAEYYAYKNKIVKTVESPRDLIFAGNNNSILTFPMATRRKSMMFFLLSY